RFPSTEGRRSTFEIQSATGRREPPGRRGRAGDRWLSVGLISHLRTCLNLKKGFLPVWISAGNGRPSRARAQKAAGAHFSPAPAGLSKGGIPFVQPPPTSITKPPLLQWKRLWPTLPRYSPASTCSTRHGVGFTGAARTSSTAVPPAAAAC